MRATWLDGVPILFDWPPSAEASDSGLDRALVDEFGDRITFDDYEGEYPLRAHALIVSLSKLEECEPVRRRFIDSL